MKIRAKKIIWVILPVVLSLLISCATIPKTTTTGEFKANLGTIGIVSATFQPEVRLNKPMGKGAAVWHFAGKGAAMGLWAASQGGGSAGPAGLLVALGLVPVGAAVGSLVGLVKGLPSNEIKEPEKALRSYLETVNFQDSMRERFLAIARQDLQSRFIPLEVQGPKAPDEVFTYVSLSESGIDTVLEISVRKCELIDPTSKRAVNPNLYLSLSAAIRLIRVADGKMIYGEQFVDQWSNALKFSEWAANDAELFREALDHAFQYLAGRMVDRLIAIQAPPEPLPSEDLQEREHMTP